MFRVMSRSTPFQRSEKRVGSYVVSDRPEGWDTEEEWPVMAEFHVSMRHDMRTQERRAFEYAEYLNFVNKPVPAITDVLKAHQ